MKLLKKQARRGFTLVELLVVIAIIAILASLATPAVFSALKAGELTKTTSNMKQLGISFLQYDQQFQSYPVASHGTDFPDAINETRISAGTGSNGELSLLIASGVLESEEIFFAKGGSTSSDLEPDNNFASTAECLKAGENGMSYIKKDATTSFSTSDNSAIPVLIAPLIAVGEFNPDPYNNKGVVLRIDSSVKQGPINSEGDTLLISNRDVLTTVAGSPLDGTNVDISIPD